jgi:hypothetical protein
MVWSEPSALVPLSSPSPPPEHAAAISEIEAASAMPLSHGVFFTEKSPRP